MDDSGLLTRGEAAKAALGGEDADDVLVAPGDTYATVKGPRVANAIEFIPRNDDPFIIPYGYLPLLWPKRPDIILVEYPTLFTVRLRAARRIDWLKRLIRDQRLIWIRECSEAEASTLHFAVTAIDILRSFPSREVGINPHAKRP